MMRNFIFVALLLLSVTPASAQIISGNLFLQGAYLECGFLENGAMGSCVPPPAGYHPHSGSQPMMCSGDSNLVTAVYDFGHDG